MAVVSHANNMFVDDEQLAMPLRLVSVGSSALKVTPSSVERPTMKLPGLPGGPLYSLPHAQSSGPLAVWRVARHCTPTVALTSEKLMSLLDARHRPFSLVPT